MRVLVTSTPGAGHVLPLTPVAQALVAAGHEVRWATGPDARQLVRAAGLTHHPAGLEQATRMARFGAGWPQVRTLAPPDRRAVMFPALFGTLSATPMYDDLVPIVDEYRPDVIVHEPAELAAAPLARRLRIPHVTVGIGRAIPSPLLAAAANEVSGLWARAGAGAPKDCGTYEHRYLHPLPSDLELLPTETTSAGLRPLHDHDWELPYDGSRGGEPLVYLTFGTEFAPIAPWEPVLQALGALGVRTLVTVGDVIDPRRWGELAPSIRVERWVPQQEAVSAADLIISHGGAGAMIGGIVAGLPHLVLPLGADHFANAELIAEAGLGAVLPPHRIDTAAVRDAVGGMLTDTRTRRAAQSLRCALAALPSPAEAATSIARLAQ